MRHPIVSRIAELHRKHDRRKQAAALRALRKCDRAMARFVLKRWKDDEQISRMAADVLIYGYGMARIEHIPTKDLF